MFKNKNILIIIILVLVIIIKSGIFFYQKNSQPINHSNNKQNAIQEQIKVFKPQANDLINNILVIDGEAKGNWFFEATAPFYVLDSNFSTITSGFIQAKDNWMTENFVPFHQEIKIEPKTESGYLVLKNDNPSGLPEKDLFLMIPIKFDLSEMETSSENSEKMIIKVFFNNNNLDPEFSCNKVFPVEREVVKTQAIARAALEELLKGVNEEEKNQGYFTNINPNVTIQSLKIENGIAYVDFNEQLEFQVGGSCRVSAIRAQITQTLKQFPTIKDVIISINGRKEDILQP